MRMTRITRIALVAAALVLGGVFGVAGTIIHASVLWSVIPAGMIVAAIGCAALLVAARLLSPDRWTAVACGVGMLAMLTVFSGRGPGGSVVVPVPAEGEFPFGYVWTFLLAGIVLVAIAWPDLSRARARRSAQPSV